MEKVKRNKRKDKVQKAFASNLKENKAITLIALVITIIVLLILAGVTISAISANENVMDKAKESKEKTEEANDLDVIKLKMVNSLLEEEWDGTVADGFASTSGSGDREDDPYIIENGAQLAYLAAVVNGDDSVELPNGLTDRTFKGKYVSVVNSINLGNKEFTPIGLGNNIVKDSGGWTDQNSFKGTLNGNNNVITGIQINKPDRCGVGLIGILEEEGTAKNIIIYEGNITGMQATGSIVGGLRGKVVNCQNSATIKSKDNASKGGSGEDAGGIVGKAQEGIIQNCINYGSVSTLDDCGKTGRGKGAGGIIGSIGYSKEEMTISNCKNYGKVLVSYQLGGGMIGTVQDSKKLTIQSCDNYGDVSTGTNTNLNTSTVGGIVGWAKSEVDIISCTNSGTITSNKSNSGGIVGEINIGSITGCTNSGEVTANKNYSGGIAGFQEAGSITGCTNRGIVKANSQVAGGIIGYMSSGSITGCTNSGTITANTNYAGGILAYQIADATVTNCNNSGLITAKQMVSGGIIGISMGNVSNCDNSGNIVADYQLAGGIAGWLTSGGKISNCFNKGNIEGKSEGRRGIAGGVVAWVENSSLSDVLNLGEVKIGKYSDPEKINAAGGITGYYTGGTIANAYTKCEIIGDGETKGGVVGQKTGGTISNTYYYASEDSTMPGIYTGAETSDVTNKTQDIYNALNDFINWCKANNKYVTIET